MASPASELSATSEPTTAATMLETTRDAYQYMLAMHLLYSRGMARGDALSLAASLRDRLSEDSNGDVCGLDAAGRPIAGGLSGFADALVDEQSIAGRAAAKRQQLEQAQPGRDGTLTL